MVGRLQQLQAGPWWRTGLMRLGGMFTDAQYQAAAGEDIHGICRRRGDLSELYDPSSGGVDASRFYTRFQVKGLHCWLVHVRLRPLPRERVEALVSEVLERLWEYDGMRDAVEGEGLELIQALKYQKELQVSWHGMAQALDEALKQPAGGPQAEALAEVLLRNVYADEEGGIAGSAEPAALWLAEYLLAQMSHLAALPDDEILLGRLTWAPPPPPHASGAELRGDEAEVEQAAGGGR